MMRETSMRKLVKSRRIISLTRTCKGITVGGIREGSTYHKRAELRGERNVGEDGSIALVEKQEREENTSRVYGRIL